MVLPGTKKHYVWVGLVCQCAYLPLLANHAKKGAELIEEAGIYQSQKWKEDTTGKVETCREQGKRR